MLPIIASCCGVSPKLVFLLILRRLDRAAYTGVMAMILPARARMLVIIAVLWAIPISLVTGMLVAGLTEERVYERWGDGTLNLVRAATGRAELRPFVQIKEVMAEEEPDISTPELIELLQKFEYENTKGDEIEIDYSKLNAKYRQELALLPAKRTKTALLGFLFWVIPAAIGYAVWHVKSAAVYAEKNHSNQNPRN